MLLCGCQSFIKESYLLTHTRLTALCLGLPRWAGTTKVKPIWILLEQEIVSGSGISWATCKSAPRSRQITTPIPHHSVFYRPDALPAAQPTASKHWRHSSDTVWEYCDVELKWCEGRCVYRGGESGSVEVDPADCEGRRDFSAAGSCSCQSDDPLITFAAFAAFYLCAVLFISVISLKMLSEVFVFVCIAYI